MIDFKNLNKAEPYKIFEKYYIEASSLKQSSIEAMALSSFNKISNEVESRYVNLKYIDNSDFIFFTNYNSLKASNFNEHNQISALFYWNKVNIQIRIKANIYKTSYLFSQEHFINRSKKKNALAISSRQSKKIDSYEEILTNFKNTLEKEDLNNCPDYWGGYSFTPYYFEFWKGNDSRLNKRDVYEMIDSVWHHHILQP